MAELEQDGDLAGQRSTAAGELRLCSAYSYGFRTGCNKSWIGVYTGELAPGFLVRPCREGRGGPRRVRVRGTWEWKWTATGTASEGRAGWLLYLEKPQRDFVVRSVCLTILFDFI
jgi:hypothetical protein